MKCEVCENKTEVFGNAKVLGRHKVTYYQYPACGFIQTEHPYWLEEAYSKTITTSDIGLISRNLAMADITKNVILLFHNPRGRYIDYGGGYGLFVRIMRDGGYDFHRHDPLCENLFAVGFEASSEVNYDMLTAWEVFEHLVEPCVEIEKMLSFSQEMLFSTGLLPAEPKPLGEWWYYGLEHGQHVSFYTRSSLEIIARKFGLQLVYSNGICHWLRKEPVSPLLAKAVFSLKHSWLRMLFPRRAPSSLLQKDFENLTGISMK